MISSKLQAAYV
ncbi:transducin family protein / WD-40 repeat family protein [Zea mays]|nr:transducin family protein / WD-40 repeat family protein [Zea mays]